MIIPADLNASREIFSIREMMFDASQVVVL
jgi:hypothetical protein